MKNISYFIRILKYIQCILLIKVRQSIYIYIYIYIYRTLLLSISRVWKLLPDRRMIICACSSFYIIFVKYFSKSKWIYIFVVPSAPITLSFRTQFKFSKWDLCRDYIYCIGIFQYERCFSYSNTSSSFLLTSNVKYYLKLLPHPPHGNENVHC